jgi:hypothetical protein
MAQKVIFYYLYFIEIAKIWIAASGKAFQLD